MWRVVRPRMRPSFAGFVDSQILATATDSNTANYMNAPTHGLTGD
jgi:hypothetical protein